MGQVAAFPLVKKSFPTGMPLKQEELGAAEETPAKIAATETDSESEDFLSNTVNSDMSSGEEDPMDHNPPILPPQTEQKVRGTANTSRGNPASASDKKHRSLGLSKTTVLCSQSTDL